MKAFIIILVSVIIIAGLQFFINSPENESKEYNPVGRRVPELILKDLKGNAVSLSALESSVKIINFWATWCGPCMKELPVLQKILERYQDQVTLIGVNIENDPDKVRRFVKDNKISFLILLGDDFTKMQFGVSAIPQTLLVDENGYLRFIQKGFSPDFESKIESELQKLLTDQSGYAEIH